MTSMTLTAHPYTQQAFGSLKTSPFGGSYQRYLSWWNKSVAPKFAAKAGVTPTRPDISGGGAVPSQDQLLATAKQLFPIISSQDALNMAHGAVASQMDPLIKQITGTIHGQTAEGRKAMEALTERYASRAGDVAGGMSDLYATARNQEAGISDALSSYIKNQGGSLASALTSDAPINLAAIGAAAGATQMGTGVAALDNLISQGAADTAYAKKIPSYARLLGLSNAAGFEQQQGNKLQESLDALATQGQGIEGQLYGDLLNRNQSAREGRAGLLTAGLNNAATLAATQIGANVDLAGQTQQGVQYWSDLANKTGVAGFTPKERAAYAGQQVDAFIKAFLNPTMPPALPGQAPPSRKGLIIQGIPAGGGRRRDPYAYLQPQAVSYLTAKLKPLGFSKAKINELAAQALATVGITPAVQPPPGGWPVRPGPGP